VGHKRKVQRTAGGKGMPLACSSKHACQPEHSIPAFTLLIKLR
jgi:hypothetical protein